MKEAIESVAEIVTWCISTLYALSVACNQQLLMTGTVVQGNVEFMP